MSKTYTHEQIREMLDDLQTYYGRFSVMEWGWDEHNLNVVDAKYDIILGDVMADPLGPFIAAAPDIVRQLLVEVERLREGLVAIRDLASQGEFLSADANGERFEEIATLANESLKVGDQ